MATTVKAGMDTLAVSLLGPLSPSFFQSEIVLGDVSVGTQISIALPSPFPQIWGDGNLPSLPPFRRLEISEQPKIPLRTVSAWEAEEGGDISNISTDIAYVPGCLLPDTRKVKSFGNRKI